MKNEEWRSIPGFPYYEASSFGRIRRCKASEGTHIGKILQPRHMKCGYLQVGLRHNGLKQIRVQVHRLVLLAFNGIPNNGYVCNHKDGCKQNNALENLEWCSPKENYKHARDNGLQPEPLRGYDSPYTKLKPEEIWLIRRLISYKANQYTIAKMFLVGQSTISRIKNGKVYSDTQQPKKEV